MSELSIEQRVAAGAAWLDANGPGWERRIDLARLDMKNGCRCVLGQLFQDQAEEVDLTAYDGSLDRDVGFGYGFVVDEEERTSDGFGVAHGFHATSDSRGASDYAEWTALDEAWIALVKLRHDTGALSDAESA